MTITRDDDTTITWRSHGNHMAKGGRAGREGGGAVTAQHSNISVQFSSVQA